METSFANRQQKRKELNTLTGSQNKTDADLTQIKNLASSMKEWGAYNTEGEQRGLDKTITAINDYEREKAEAEKKSRRGVFGSITNLLTKITGLELASKAIGSIFGEKTLVGKVLNTLDPVKLANRTADSLDMATGQFGSKNVLRGLVNVGTTYGAVATGIKAFSGIAEATDTLAEGVASSSFKQTLSGLGGVAKNTASLSLSAMALGGGQREAPILEAPHIDTFTYEEKKQNIFTNDNYSTGTNLKLLGRYNWSKNYNTFNKQQGV